MAFSPKKHQSVASAQEIFTDREEPRRAFWDIYHGLQPGEIDAVGYYGFGGIGKTTLLRKIQEEVEAHEQKSNSYYSFEFDNRKDVCLFVLSRTIINNIKGARFPMFDFAYKTWMERMGKSEDEIKMYIASFSGKMGLLEESMDLVGDVLPTNAAKVLLKRGLEFCGNELLKKELAKPENVELADEIRRADVIKLQNQMQVYFVHDAIKIMEQRTTPYVILLDGYEALANRLIKGEKARLEEYWLWNMDNGLVPFIPNVLWVVAGRERMNWSPEIMPNDHMHLMGQISRPDVEEHFHKLGIMDDRLVEGLYKLSEGTPVYMDLCYKTYLRLVKDREPGFVPDIEEFGHDTDELAKRYLRDMSDHQQRTVFLMAVMPNIWTETLLRDVARRVRYDAFVDMAFLTIIDMSVIECNGNEYKLHDTFRRVVRAFLSDDERNRLCKGVWEELLTRIKVEPWKIQAKDEDAVMTYLSFLNSEILKGEPDEEIVTDEALKAICLGMRSYKIEGLLKEVINASSYIYDYVCANNRSNMLKILAGAEVIKALGHMGEYQKAKDFFVEISPSLVDNVTSESTVAEIIEVLKDKVSALRSDDSASEMTFAYAYYLSACSMMLLRFKEHAIASVAAEISAEVMEGLFGERDFYSIEAMGVKAISIGYTPGGNDKAANIHKKLLEVQKDLFGPKSAQVTRTQNNLANNYLSLGGNQNLDKALELHTEAYETRKAANGLNNPDTLLYLQNLAMDYEAKKDTVKALELTRQAFEGRRKVLGDKHPDTIKSATILVSRLVELNQLEEAGELMTYVVETRTVTDGLASPLTISSMIKQGDILCRLDRVEQSLSIFRQAYELTMGGVTLLSGDTASLGTKYSTALIVSMDDLEGAQEVLDNLGQHLLANGGSSRELSRLEIVREKLKQF